MEFGTGLKTQVVDLASNLGRSLPANTSPANASGMRGNAAVVVHDSNSSAVALTIESQPCFPFFPRVRTGRREQRRQAAPGRERSVRSRGFLFMDTLEYPTSPVGKQADIRNPPLIRISFRQSCIPRPLSALRGKTIPIRPPLRTQVPVAPREDAIEVYVAGPEPRVRPARSTFR